MPTRAPAERGGALANPMFLDVTTLSVDPAYVEAAARRAARGAPAHSRRSLLVLGATVAAIALLLTVAAQQARRGAPEAARVRAGLAEEADERAATTDRLLDLRATLLYETTAARDSRLRATRAGRELADELAGLELAAAGLAVSGPGVVVRLDDSAGVGGPDDPNEDGRVRDRDIQEVVNALWAAGAEAVAVNGRRVSALTAIREAGRAVLVDYRPISPPYVIEAVGDPEAVEAAFATSPTAGRFRTFTDFYGLGFSVKRADDLQLPAASTARLRYAEPGAAQ